MSTFGAIASPHALATRAGERALHDGGTAVDAAVATCAVLTVVYPHMCSIGGDIQALLALRDRLDGCIGCGCLSLKACALYNPDDACAAQGSGAQRLPAATRSDVGA